MLPLHDGRESKRVVSKKSFLIGKGLDISSFVVPLTLGIIYFLSPNPAYNNLKDDNLKDEISRNMVFERVLRIADKDSRNGTSCDEWRDVYSSIGLEYSGRYGDDLSVRQLQKYLSISEGMLSKR